MSLRPVLAVAGLALFSSAASAQTIIHQYTFAGDASDSVGTANGTLNGGATATGGVLSLDGTDDNVSFAQKIVPTSGAYSVAFFARQSSLQGNFIEWISQGSSGAPGFYLGYAPGGGIRATDSWGSTGVAFPANGQFQHIALVSDGSASSLYLNGTLAGSIASALSTTTGGDVTHFGKQFSPFDEFFKGEMKDMRIYTGALSPQQVAALASVATPEPGTVALFTALSLSAVGFAKRRRRRNRQA